MTTNVFTQVKNTALAVLVVGLDRLAEMQSGDHGWNSKADTEISDALRLAAAAIGMLMAEHHADWDSFSEEWHPAVAPIILSSKLFSRKKCAYSLLLGNLAHQAVELGRAIEDACVTNYLMNQPAQKAKIEPEVQRSIHKANKEAAHA